MDMHRNIRVLLLALCVTAVLGEDFDPTFSHGDFMRNFNKTYQDHERAAHEAAFRNNYAELLRLHGEGRDVGVNERLDWTDEEKGAFLNYKPQDSGIPPSTRPLMANALFASPTAFDWRSYGVVTPIKNQGSCGSCWAFSSTAEYESKIAIATNGTLYDLSEQYVLKCQTAYSLGCNGGYPQRALQLINRTGIPQESAYPYNPSGSAGSMCNTTTGRIKLNLTVDTIRFHYFLNLTVEQLQQDLVSYGPINVGVYASDPNFMYAGSSGGITCSYPPTIDHAIVLVGYNATHWIVKNSWGTSWGHNGFGYISKNTNNDCNIRQYVNEMQVSFSSPSPPPPDPNMVNVTITMTDSFADGWNGNVISIKQNNNVVGTFGGAFTSGSSSGPVYMLVQGNITAQIVVSQLGNKTNEVGFVIRSPNGTVLHQRNSGNAFTANALLETFCILGGCPVTMWVTVNMTDSFGDGWNSNIVGFKQNNIIVGTFGGAFTSGYVTGVLSFSLAGNIPTQIVVTQLGTKTNEVGFVVKALNGTVIYQKAAGTTFVAGNIFTGFCPSGGCPNTQTLTITMTDSYGDGWGGTALGITQNGVIVGTFGSTFTSGSSSGPAYISVLGNVQVQVLVSTLGTKTQEIGFIIRAFNGTIIYQKYNGNIFAAGTIFNVFCPNGGCPTSLYTTLTVTMTDSFRDGWNGNVLGIKQNNTVVAFFGNYFTAGASSGPLYFIVQANLATQIVVTTLGAKTNEVGFLVKAQNGAVLHQRYPWKAFESTRVFAIFCPVTGCSNILTLTVTMTDSFSDGWNGNVLALRQNSSIVGVFGESFTTGSSSGPLSINVIGDLFTQIAVAQLGTKTNEVGFVVKAPNGTVIHQRGSGTTFTANTLFKTFCPIGGCIQVISLILNITMTDSWGDGWQGNILAIKQNNTVVGTFGSTFTSGTASGPVYITVQGGMEAQIVVHQLGGSTGEVGFTVKAPNGTIIHQRTSGTIFGSGTIFATFCPAGGCPVTPNVTYYLTTSDSYGDGWQGTILAFKQNGSHLYTFTLASGSVNSSITFSFPKFVSVSVTVYVLGNYTNEIGFSLKNSLGSTIIERIAGTKFFVNTLLGTFCPQCTNLSPVTILPDVTEAKKPKLVTDETDQATTSTQSPIYSSKNSYMIATFVLTGLAVILIVVSSIALFKLYKVSKEAKLYRSEKSTQNSPQKEKSEQSHNASNAVFSSSPEKTLGAQVVVQ